MSAPTTTVKRPCSGCAHAEVCGIRPDIADWKVELPTLHSAITARAVVTLDCRHFLPRPVMPTPVNALAPEPTTEAPVKRRGGRRPGPQVLSDDTRARLREAGRRSGAARAYDVEAMFAAIRSTSSLQDAAAQLGLARKTVYNRLARLAERDALPADIAERRREIAGFPRQLSDEAREAMRAAGRKAGRGRALAFDREELFAALRRSPTISAAAVALGIEPNTMGKRMAWLRKHDALPEDLRDRKWHRNGTTARREFVKRPVRPTTRPQAAPAAPSKPKEPEHEWQGPKLVVELPTPVWPAPLPASVAAAPPDDFAERRAQAAREAADRSWRDRHPEGVAG